MPPTARVPRELAFLPFLGSTAVAEGLITWSMLRGRPWHRLLPDTYVHTDGYRADDHRMWCEAVALGLPPGAAITGLSAAYLWGVDLLDRTNVVTVSIPKAARPRRHPRIAVSHQRLPAEDIVAFTGLPLTIPARTAFDLGRRANLVEAVVAVDALLRRRLVRVDQLQAYVATHAGWPGAVQLRRVLALAEPSTESPMETRIRLVVIDGGLPAPAVQHEVRDPQGRLLGRVDLAYPQWRIAIEYEGDHHRERRQFRQDVARLNALRGNGWIVLRFTADDVFKRRATIVAQVKQAIAERRTATP